MRRSRDPDYAAQHDAETSASVRPQSLHRIYIRSPPRRQVAGQECRDQQADGYDPIGQGSAGFTLLALTLRQTSADAILGDTTATCARSVLPLTPLGLSSSPLGDRAQTDHFEADKP